MSTIATPTTNTPPSSAPPLASSPATQVDRDTTPRTAARVAGVSYVILFALGIFSNFIVREGLIVNGDAQATASNIAESEGLFRLGMVGFLIIFFLDVIVAWSLYIVFRKPNRDLSLLAAWFRLVYTVFLGTALIYFFQALQFLDNTAFLADVDTTQRQAQTLVALNTFNSAWLIGLAAFGIHLILLGGLVLQSRYAPRGLGYVLIAAGAAYMIDTFAHTLLGSYTDYETFFIIIVAVPAVVAEGWFGLWLLLRAGKDQPVESLATTQA